MTEIFPQEFNDILEFGHVSGIELHERLVSLQNGWSGFGASRHRTRDLLQLLVLEALEIDRTTAGAISASKINPARRSFSGRAALNINQSVQTEVSQELQIPRTGVENVEKTVTCFLKFQAKTEQYTQESAVQISTCAEINYETMCTIFK